MRRLPRKKAGAPGWMTTFADLMALMLTFFVLMLSLAKIDVQKYEQALISIQDSFGKPWHGRLTGTGSLLGETGVSQHVVVVVDAPAQPSVDTDPDIEAGSVDPLFNAIKSALEHA